jgi:hypothetical protein
LIVDEASYAKVEPKPVGYAILAVWGGGMGVRKVDLMYSLVEFVLYHRVTQRSTKFRGGYCKGFRKLV